MENNKGSNKLIEYVNQHIAIVTFLVEEQEKLIEIMSNDSTDEPEILKFLNEVDELEPFVDEFVDKYMEEDMFNSINAMEPSDVFKMIGKLADIFDISDTVMDIYSKHTKKGGQ